MNTKNTLVIQSHQEPLPHSWLQQCINSVKFWAELNQFEYKFIDDELFSYIPAKLLDKTKLQTVVATDLARLRVLQSNLEEFETVIWCDADFLIFYPEKLILSEELYSLGREVWIQMDGNQLRSYTKVHNAFMMFKRGNSFLDFYADTAERLLDLNTGAIPPQFIGPKLLTALSNIVQCPILETAGMLSPLVIKDIANNSGAALELFIQDSPQLVFAANLCSSLYESNEIDKKEIEKCIEVLLNNKSLNNNITE